MTSLSDPTTDTAQSDDSFIRTADLVYLWVLYLLYVVSGAVVLIPSQTLPAAIAITLAALLTRIKRREKHMILSTHYQWLRRTFWIGMGLYLTVFSLLTLIIAAPSVDTTALMDAVTNGQATTPEEMNDLLMAQQPASSRYTIIGLGIAFTLWWVWRCGCGMYALWRQQAVAKPLSWI